jgi:predicted metal-dependent hydrolase
METITLAGNPPIVVHLKRSAGARRLSLRVGRVDGRVTLSLPRRTPLREAEAFARTQAAWIAGHLARKPVVMHPVIGGQVQVLGRPLTVITGKTRVARLTADAVVVPDDPARVGPRIKALLMTLARTHLVESTQRYADTLGRPFGRLTLRDTRSRWGSCTSRGDLMYSWRLVMAPWDVLDYVAAHEVAHLAHMDHSPRFWAQVEALLPAYAPHRAWLKQHGADLHGWNFDPIDAPDTPAQG